MRYYRHLRAISQRLTGNDDPIYSVDLQEEHFGLFLFDFTLAIWYIFNIVM